MPAAGFRCLGSALQHERLFVRVPWLNPRPHPWRFALALVLFVGALLLLAQLQEGLPPSLVIGMMVMGIFPSAELAATLLGFTLFGGYLGLRPPIRFPFSGPD